MAGWIDWVMTPGSATYTYVGIGGLQTGGTALLARARVASTSGGVSTGGAALVVPPSHSWVYIPAAGVVLSGAASHSRTKVYRPSGGVIFAGAARAETLKLLGGRGLYWQLMKLSRPNSVTSSTGVVRIIGFVDVAIFAGDLQRRGGVIAQSGGGVRFMQQSKVFSAPAVPIAINDRITNDRGEKFIVRSVANVFRHHLEVSVEFDDRP